MAARKKELVPKDKLTRESSVTVDGNRIVKTERVEGTTAKGARIRIISLEIEQT
jgi:hypothetical protein